MFGLNISPRFERAVSVSGLEALRQFAASAVASARKMRFGTGAKGAVGLAAALSLSVVAMKSDLLGGHSRDGKAPSASADQMASQPAKPASPLAAVVADSRINVNGIDPKPTGSIAPVPVAETQAVAAPRAKRRHRAVAHPAKPKRVAVVQAKPAKDRKPPAR